MTEQPPLGNPQAFAALLAAAPFAEVQRCTVSLRTQEGTAPGPGLARSHDASGASGLQAALPWGLIWGSGERLTGSRLRLPVLAPLRTPGGRSDRDGTDEKVT